MGSNNEMQRTAGKRGNIEIGYSDENKAHSSEEGSNIVTISGEAVDSKNPDSSCVGLNMVPGYRSPSLLTIENTEQGLRKDNAGKLQESGNRPLKEIPTTSGDFSELKKDSTRDRKSEVSSSPLCSSAVAISDSDSSDEIKSISKDNEILCCSKNDFLGLESPSSNAKPFVFAIPVSPVSRSDAKIPPTSEEKRVRPNNLNCKIKPKMHFFDDGNLISISRMPRTHPCFGKNPPSTDPSDYSRPSKSALFNSLPKYRDDGDRVGILPKTESCSKSLFQNPVEKKKDVEPGTGPHSPMPSSDFSEKNILEKSQNIPVLEKSFPVSDKKRPEEMLVDSKMAHFACQKDDVSKKVKLTQNRKICEYQDELDEGLLDENSDSRRMEQLTPSKKLKTLPK